MGEMSGESGSPSELEQFPELQYARNLFVQLFRDESPLINLGYTQKQRAIARRAIAVLEGPGAILFGPNPYAHFESQDSSSAEIESLTRGGFNMMANQDMEREGGTFGLMRALFASQTVEFFKNLPSETVATVSMIDSSVDLDDVASVTAQIYEGWIKAGTEIGPKSFLGNIKSRLRANLATFRGKWRDENKLELLVETDYVSRTSEEKDKSIFVWRRLSEEELDSRIWLPFGLKPNVSDKAMQAELNRSKESLVHGNLALQRR